VGKEFGLGARLTFSVGKAIQNIGKADKAYSGLNRSMAKVSQGAKKIGQGFQKLGIASAIAGAGAGFAVKKFADFEKQISVVASIASATAEQQKALGAAAKEAGATTAFTATQSAEALQFLALAGFTVEQQIGTLPAVLNLAAAGSLDLARASDIVTDTMTAMGLGADDAGRAVDVFSLVQAKANTNVEQLGEAFKFAAPTLRGLNISLEEGSALLGKLADAGLKGSIGGTSLVNMFEKLAKPSKAATAFLDEFNVTLVDAQGNFLPTSQLIANISGALEQVEGTANRARITTEIFGLRGKKAFSALSAAGAPAIESLISKLEGASTMMDKRFPDAVGAGAIQAAQRLDNLSGRFTLFQSATDGVLIEVGSLIGNFLGPGIGKATAFISDLALTLTGLSDGFKGPEQKARLLGTTAGQVAVGIREGIKSLSAFVSQVRSSVFEPLFGFLARLSPETKKLFTIITIVGTGALAILGPVLLAIGLMAPAIGGIISIVSGLGSIIFGVFGIVISAFSSVIPAVLSIGGVFSTVFGFIGSAIGFIVPIVTGLVGVLSTAAGIIVSVVFSPIGIAIGLVVGAFFLLRREGESVFGTLGRLLTTVKDIAVSVFTSIGDGALAAFNFVGEAIGSVVNAIPNLISSLASIGSSVFNSMVEVGASIFEFTKNLAISIATLWFKPFKVIGKFIISIFSNIGEILLAPINFVFESITSILRKIAGTTLGRAALKIIGIKKEDVDSFVKVAPPSTAAVTPAAEVSQAGLARTEALTTAAAPVVVEPAKPVEMPTIVIENKLTVDGQEMAVATGRSQVENAERTGQLLTPGEKRQMLEGTISPKVGIR